jgi:hypothetical protein
MVTPSCVDHGPRVNSELKRDALIPALDLRGRDAFGVWTPTDVRSATVEGFGLLLKRAPTLPT